MVDYILEMKDIRKTYPGVVALDNVNLDIERGEIHALVGENGAGKSTLMNILSGTITYKEYDGKIIYNGEECKFNKISDSEAKGIVIIHQELALIPELTIAENMFLGNENKNKLGLIDWNLTNKKAKEAMDIVGLESDSNTLVKDIGTGKQQLLEIAKAISKDVKLLILDEPTSSLNEADSRKLLDMLIKFKKEKGITSIIITHKLNEVAYCSDRITVLRDGKSIETMGNPNHDIDEEKIIKGMVGRELVDRYPVRERNIGKEIVFEVKNWSVYHPVYTEKKIVDNISFNVKKGEVIGFSGLQGAGRTELFKSLFGKSYGTKITGTEIIKGEDVNLKNVKDAIEKGLAYATEDRKTDGLILTESIAKNTTLARMDKISSKRGFIDVEKEKKESKDLVKAMRTKTPSIEQSVGNLSGGNQQKVLLAKWMFAEPEILILDEPSRGIDVGAKYEIYTIINDMISQGKSVVMISSELPELLGMCDRVYVMNEGRMAGEFSSAEATQEKIMGAILKERGEEV
ncbi:MAG: ATP-binding cassette domain-containing protein [Catonella sp.]|uniref:ATP-binding cassette domain-containing protein n=1 Tax=Catonella sp. TaxID=2382125 RepID=UPI003F9FC998